MKVLKRQPGELDEHGSPFCPKAEPDLGVYVKNRFVADYGEGNGIDRATGFLTSDGTPVPMGLPGDVRADDHRAAIPPLDAMRRWGWPEEVCRHYAEGTRTPALFELMRRGKIARLHVERRTLRVDHVQPLTGRQKMVIVQWAWRNPGCTIDFECNGRQSICSSEEVADELDR